MIVRQLSRSEVKKCAALLLLLGYAAAICSFGLVERVLAHLQVHFPPAKTDSLRLQQEALLQSQLTGQGNIAA